MITASGYGRGLSTARFVGRSGPNAAESGIVRRQALTSPQVAGGFRFGDQSRSAVSEILVPKTAVTAQLISSQSVIDQSSAPEFQVNTTTGNAQQNASVAALADGGFVVVYESDGQDGDGFGIYGQRYDASGDAVGGEFRINSTTADVQRNATVTALADGGFVVTFESNASLLILDNYDIYGQRFDANGDAVDGQFRVNTTTSNAQQNASVTALDDGGFLVTYQSNGQDGSGYGVYGQRYDSDGAAVGGEFRVNSTTANAQQNASVTALSDGGFVIVYESDGQDGSGFGVYGQRYDAAGAAVGGEFRVNSTTGGAQQNASVTALDDGGFVVVYESDGQDGDGLGVYGQRYDGDGAAVGTEFQINATTAGAQQNASVSALEDGGFLVTYESDGQDGSGYGVYARQFDSDGAAVGAEFLVNTTTAGHQTGASVARLADGRLIVAYEDSAQDGSSYGLFARKLDTAVQNTYEYHRTVVGFETMDVAQGGAALFRFGVDYTPNPAVEIGSLKQPAPFQPAVSEEPVAAADTEDAQADGVAAEAKPHERTTAVTVGSMVDDFLAARVGLPAATSPDGNSPTLSVGQYYLQTALFQSLPTTLYNSLA